MFSFLTFLAYMSAASFIMSVVMFVFKENILYSLYSILVAIYFFLVYYGILDLCDSDDELDD